MNEEDMNFRDENSVEEKSEGEIVQDENTNEIFNMDVEEENIE